jgi:hypothetical protein
MPNEQEDRGLRDAVMVVVVNHMDRYHGGWWEGDAEMVDRILDLLAARPAAEERDRLAAEVERLRDHIHTCAGHNGDTLLLYCASCGAVEDDPHKPDCLWPEIDRERKLEGENNLAPEREP